MHLKSLLGVLSLSVCCLLSGCSDDDNPSSSGSGSTAGTMDLAITTAIDFSSGFLNLADGSTSQSMTNINGVDINPSRGVFSYGGYVYLTGSMADNKLSKYAVQADNTLKLEMEIDVVDDGFAIPTSIIFANDSKAYLTLIGSGDLLVFNPQDLSISKRINLAQYAMDEGGALGGEDTNPEPGGGVIRGDKLYLGLGQVNTLENVSGAWACRGLASVLIIDTASDEILDHITDDRTCSSSNMAPQSRFTLTENGDIYVNNIASIGFDSVKKPGYLRIKNGEDVFDPEYFFNVGDLDLSADFPELDPAMARTSYARMEAYNDGYLYTVLQILGLTSNPPDWFNDRNYQPYKLDLVNQKAIKLDMLPSSGMSSTVSIYKGEVVFPLSTVNGNGLYKENEQTPYIVTEGAPVNATEIVE